MRGVDTANCATKARKFDRGEFGRNRQAPGSRMVCRVIPALLGPLVIQPVLLHGDLWVRAMHILPKIILDFSFQSGNTGTDVGTGEPVIFDPSSYFGHNEAE